MDALVLAAIEAEAQGGAVTVDGVEIEDVNPLGLKLERASKGLLLVDENGAHYLALPVEDITALLAITAQASTVTRMMGQTIIAQGATIEATNPAITPEREELERLITEFERT